MRRTALLLTLALVSPAAAQEPPRVPTRDYAATYTMTGFGAEAPKTMEMSFSAATKRQRVDMADAGQNISMIMELGGSRMWVLQHESRMAIELSGGAPGDRDVPISRFDKDVRLTRVGTDRVVGLACTVYRVIREGKPQGTACVTEHGIMLRGEFEADGEGGTMEATRVSLDRQPAERFEVPPGYQTMQMPAVPRGQPPRR
ncbi:DUF4412 domain-containing protein [Elioraea tepidiphila]|jgi:hypothetical protein|uniref:DUF4412 domain-containing protein n=1 Tax=Elioraea tepidiphila TaxID=457934 RepID=UPI000371CBD3|nr:DUF4412 domain-containing protein [Elioraea tepidiphila]